MPRHSDFTEALADRICDELMSGQSLTKICEAADMPHRVTVIRWMENNPEFATRCAYAREAQADLMDDTILDAARQTLSGEIDPAAARVAIAAYQWRASKLQPKKYGDKLDLNHSGAVDFKQVPLDELQARLAKLRADHGGDRDSGGDKVARGKGSL